jgi:hypothetical protein
VRRIEHLIPYSHDHQHTLAMALRLARAASSGDRSALAAAVEGALSFARQELAAHMQQEETVLLPQFAALGVTTDDEVIRIAAEHLQLRQLHRALAQTPDDANLAAEFAELLRAHVRWEERELFEAWQRRLEAAGHDLAEVDLDEQPPPGRLYNVAASPEESGAVGLALGELNATCVSLAARKAVAASGDRDTAIICTGGSGAAVIGSNEHATTEALKPGSTILLAADTPRRLIAGDEGLSFVTVHRRRGPLQLRRRTAP